MGNTLHVSGTNRSPADGCSLPSLLSCSLCFFLLSSIHPATQPPVYPFIYPSVSPKWSPTSALPTHRPDPQAGTQREADLAPGLSFH